MGSPIDLMGAVREKERAENQDFEAKVDAQYHVIYGADLAKPLPPKNWLCKALAIAPGPPTILGGPGFGGKTMIAQALAMAVATGTKLWGHLEVRQGEVLHLDWEQDELTVRRYQRMARTLHVDLAELGRLLGSSLIPNAFLDDSGGERALAYLCRGKALCIVDSFRAAFPKAEENSSGIYQHLAALSRVSKATGCTIVTIAHARKMGNETDDVRSSLRGSAAMFDASATVYMMTGTKGKATRVTNTKERNTGKLRDDFGIRIVDDLGPRTESSDCEGDMDPEWGLHIEYLSPPELQAEYMDTGGDDNSIAINGERLRTASERVFQIIANASNGIGIATLRAVVGLPALIVTAALQELEAACAITREGRGMNAVYQAVEDIGGREPGID